jgi:hypothetical protein
MALCSRPFHFSCDVLASGNVQNRAWTIKTDGENLSCALQTSVLHQRRIREEYLTKNLPDWLGPESNASAVEGKKSRAVLTFIFLNYSVYFKVSSHSAAKHILYRCTNLSRTLQRTIRHHQPEDHDALLWYVPFPSPDENQ